MNLVGMQLCLSSMPHGHVESPKVGYAKKAKTKSGLGSR